MKVHSDMPQNFASALHQNYRSAEFYENCTDDQKIAILSQVHNMNTPEKMQAFVDNLPSATL